jgi:CheY-like chemotaxis protein
MEARGFEVATAESVADGLLQVEKAPPFYAVVDMRLGDGNGLDVISALKKRRPEAHGVVLTGYGNIATAVNAVKLGAIDYLAKPADADDVVNALLAIEGRAPSRRKIRCRPTACAGSTSSASTSCAIATSRRPRAGSTCTAAPAAHPGEARAESDPRRTSYREAGSGSGGCRLRVAAFAGYAAVYCRFGRISLPAASIFRRTRARERTATTA